MTESEILSQIEALEEEIYEKEIEGEDVNELEDVLLRLEMNLVGADNDTTVTR